MPEVPGTADGRDERPRAGHADDRGDVRAGSVRLRAAAAGHASGDRHECRRGRTDLVGGLRLLPGGQHRGRRGDDPLGCPGGGGVPPRPSRLLGMAAIAVAQGVAALAVGVLLAGAAAGMAFPPYADIVDRDVPEQPPRRRLVDDQLRHRLGRRPGRTGRDRGRRPVANGMGRLRRSSPWPWAHCPCLLAPARTSEQLRRPQLSLGWFFCPRSRPLLLSAVLVGGGSSVWWAFSVDAMRNAGLDATPARIVYAVCGAAMLLASFSGVVFERRGLRPSYLGSTALLAASLGLLAAATSNVVAVLVAAVLFGAFYATVIAAHGIWSATSVRRPSGRRPGGRTAPRSPSARSPDRCWPGSRSSTAATPPRWSAPLPSPSRRSRSARRLPSAARSSLRTSRSARRRRCGPSGCRGRDSNPHALSDNGF